MQTITLTEDQALQIRSVLDTAQELLREGKGIADECNWHYEPGDCITEIGEASDLLFDKVYGPPPEKTDE